MKDLPKELADAVELSQNQFDSRRTEMIDRVEDLDRAVRLRRRIAQGLKSVTVVCGIVLTTGFLAEWSIQLLGALVLLIASLEYVFANYDHLLSMTAARDALKRVRRQAEDILEEHIVQIVSIRDSRPKESAERLISLTQTLRKDLAGIIDKVEAALEERNYELLNRLSLADTQREEDQMGDGPDAL